MTTRAKHILSLSILLILGMLYHYKYINDFPTYIHAWAQSERYALAFGFIRNNLNFFMPETFVMNQSFPNGWIVPTTESITAVDFPVHDFIPALIMKITGIKSPWVFRLYILLYSFAGLVGLFKLSYLFSKSFLKSIFIVAFASTSPIFVFYQGGFLPTIPSLSNAIIGLYFYAKYLHDYRNMNFNISILFLTLAALARISFTIPLLAILAPEFIRIIKKVTRLKPKILPIFLAAVFILSYYFYNNYLRSEYGSMFLNQIRPATSMGQATEILYFIFKHWFFHYYSKIHYLIFGVLIIIALYFFSFQRLQINKIILQFGFLILVILSGCVILFLLMLNQFRVHDYYFLDTFFLPSLLLLIFLLTLIPVEISKRNKVIYGMAALLICIPMIINAVKMQNIRRVVGPEDRTSTMIKNYTGSDDFLDSIGIPRDAIMLVPGANAPNIPFILMDRKGYVIMDFNMVYIKEALLWNYDFIVTENEFFISDISIFDPEITAKIIKVAENGKITVWKPLNNKND